MAEQQAGSQAERHEGRNRQANTPTTKQAEIQAGTNKQANRQANRRRKQRANMHAVTKTNRLITTATQTHI